MFFGLNDVAFLAAVSAPALDPDAAAYIAAVEAADTQALEPAVRAAINDFVVGCKADGIWNAIKASCILAGARTLTGALVPLVGTAPTNVGGLFVSGDYNRKTGLVGNGSTKYLNSNRNNNADPQNSKHLSCYVGNAASGSSTQVFIGNDTVAVSGVSLIYKDGAADGGTERVAVNVNGSSAPTGSAGSTAFQTGFLGANRTTSSSVEGRVFGVSINGSVSSQTPGNSNVIVFARTASSPARFCNARLAFYSIGESLNLALLDARVTTLINAIAAAIP